MPNNWTGSRAIHMFHTLISFASFPSPLSHLKTSSSSNIMSPWIKRAYEPVEDDPSRFSLLSSRSEGPTAKGTLRQYWDNLREIFTLGRSTEGDSGSVFTGTSGYSNETGIREESAQEIQVITAFDDTLHGARFVPEGTPWPVVSPQAKGKFAILLHARYGSYNVRFDCGLLLPRVPDSDPSRDAYIWKWRLDRKENCVEFRFAKAPSSRHFGRLRTLYHWHLLTPLRLTSFPIDYKPNRPKEEGLSWTYGRYP